MIATDSIPAETLLIHTPGSLVLPLSNENQCGFVGEIIKEMKVGAQSKWHPYFKYDDSSGSRVPSQWDREGRATKELQGMPSAGETHRHVDWYTAACIQGGVMSEYDWKAMMMFVTRAADLGMVPLYDLMNHHNGLINTRSERDDEGGLRVIALMDVPANSPIYNTYAASGIESTVDVFNTYGFVEDYPRLFRWTNEQLIALSQEKEDHAYDRYGLSNSDPNNEPGDRLHFEPNSRHYEVLVISPTLAALSPTKKLTQALGSSHRSLEEWGQLIGEHHANLRPSLVNALHDSYATILNKLSTSVEEDEALILDEKRNLEKVRKLGRVDMNKADAIQAIEFRLAFKKALRLAMDIAEKESFLVDTEEL
ncbi:hypothetical protein ACHAWF_005418 [Thalassiosira exigua]